MTFHSRLNAITTFIFDMDGVLTDGSLYAVENGELVRRFNIKDGYALKTALDAGFRVALVTGGKSEAARKRFFDLGIRDLYMGIANKAEVVSDYLLENGIAAEEVVYMGDDMPDYEAMKMAGIPSCPSNAIREIKAISLYISPLRGGEGCVRDIIEKVLKVQGKWT